MEDRYDENGNDKPSSLTRCFTDIADTTLFLERSEVRSMIIQQFQQTGEPVLRAIDALPIFSAEDIRGAAQGQIDRGDPGCKDPDCTYGKEADYVHLDNVVYHLDDIEVDKDGKCAWADVANALTYIKLCREPFHPAYTVPDPIAAERARCIAICESWVGTFQDVEIKYTAPREYAINAINDIVDLIRNGHTPAVSSTSRECGLCGGPLPCLTHSQGLPLSSTHHEAPDA